jgi:hypothetical protein
MEHYRPIYGESILFLLLFSGNGYRGLGSQVWQKNLQQLRESTVKWDLIKLKSFCSTKEMVSKLKRTPTE